MLHPYALIKEKWLKICLMERVEGMVLVGKDFRVVRRGIPANDVITMRHEYFPNKELYATNRMVHITRESSEEDLFDLERPSLESSIASAVVPPEEGVDRFRDKEYEETPLTTLPSGICGITVTKVATATLHCEGIAVDDEKNCL